MDLSGLPIDSLRELALKIGVMIFILFIILIIRFLLKLFIAAPLRRRAEKTHSTWDELIADLISIPLRWLTLTAILYVFLHTLFPALDEFTLHLTRSLLIITVSLVLFRAVGLIAFSRTRLFRLTGLSIEERLVPFLRTALRLILIALTLVIVVQEWGYDVSGLVAGLGLGGLAFSLAAKDTLENLFGFSAIVGDSPFNVGDTIRVDSLEGTVEHVGLRSTRMRNSDQSVIVVPNSKVAASAISNLSRLNKRWLDMTITVDLGVSARDMHILLTRLREMLMARDHVQKDSIIVRLMRIAPSGYEVLIRCYILLIKWDEFVAEREMINFGIMYTLEQLHMPLTPSTPPVNPISVDSSPKK